MLKIKKIVLPLALTICFLGVALSTSFAIDNSNLNIEGLFQKIKTQQGKHYIRIDGKWYTLQTSARITLCGEKTKRAALSDYKGAQVNFTLENETSEEITQIDILCE